MARAHVMRIEETEAVILKKPNGNVPMYKEREADEDRNRSGWM